MALDESVNRRLLLGECGFASSVARKDALRGVGELTDVRIVYFTKLDREDDRGISPCQK